GDGFIYGCRPAVPRHAFPGPTDRFRPDGELLSLVWPRESNQREGHPDIRVWPLRGQTSLAPVLLRRPSGMGRPWPNPDSRGIHAAHLLRNTCARPSVRGFDEVA